MIAFAEYLLKVIVCSAVFTGYYWLALRNKVFHEWNRFYLLAVVVISLLLPFVKITVFSSPALDEQAVYQAIRTITTDDRWFEDETVAVTVKPSLLTAENIVAVLYMLFSLFAFLIFCIAVLKLVKLYKNHRHWTIQNITFVDTNAKGTPFSFLRYIFWNSKIDFHSHQGQQIFAHELVHVKQKHSWDKLFVNAVLIFFWSNPFFWLIKKELGMIHEFIADKQSLKGGDTAAFASMILAVAFPGHTLPLTNPFFYSPIKRRLFMLTKLNNPKVGYISRLLLLPVLTFLFVAFAVKTKQTKTTPVPVKLEKELTVVVDAAHGLKDGHPTGAKSKDGFSEDEFSLSLAKLIADINKNEKIKIILTRTDENDVELKKRGEFVNAQNPDLLISLHANFAPPVKEGNAYVENPLNGIEAYISKRNTVKNRESSLFGTLLLNEVSKIINPNRGIKTREQGIWIIDQSPCATILFECGFLSHTEDVKLMKDKTKQGEIAAAVLKAIELYAYNHHQKPVIQKDSLPEMNKGGLITSRPDDYLILIDSLVIIRGADYQASIPLIIMNGKPATLKELKGKTYRAKFAEFYPANDPETIKKFGNGTIGGAQVLYDATVIDRPASLKQAMKGNESESNVFIKAEVMPQFPGGEGAWNRYIQTYLEKNIEKLQKTGQSATCVLRFIVEKDGSINEMSATSSAPLLNEIAGEAVLKGPKWIPAIQNGQTVRCRHEKIVTFRLPETEEKQNKSTISVANATMKVLYLGLDNPLVVSGGDIPADKLILTTNNGSVKRINGQWVARPATTGEAVITITDQSASKKMQFLFTAKPVSAPIVTFAGSKGGRIPVQKAKEINQLVIDDEWDITGYAVYITGGNLESPVFKTVRGGGRFTEEVQQLISNCSPGTTLTFDEIRVKMKKADFERRVPAIFINAY